jgi:hypothetical protein
MKRLPTLFLFLVLCALTPGTSRADSPAQQLLVQAQNEYRQGDMTAAKRDFQAALQLDPRNQTAINFLRQIAVTEKAPASKIPSQEKQVAGLIIPKVEFKEATLASALDSLKGSVAKLSDGKASVNFVLQLPADKLQTPVTLSLANVPFPDVLRYLGTVANVEFAFEKFAVVVRPAASGATAATGPAPQ